VRASDFLPPDDWSLEAAGDALSRRLSVDDGAVGETDRTFYDTFDGLMYGAGLSVVHERGRLALVDRESGEERVGAPARQPTQPLLALGLHPGPLRDALLPIVDVRALLPLVHVHSRVRALDVRDGESKTVMRITLEQPTLVVSSSRHTALRPRLRLAVVRGYDNQLKRVRRQLEAELGFRPADQPLVDEAVRAAGGVPGGSSSKVNLPLSYDQQADAATAAVLRALLGIIEANLEGTIADVDAEFLHDFRVAVRRSRAVQRELGSVFPAEELARFRAEFRWLQRVTGDSRDLDVYVLGFDSMRSIVPEQMRSDLDPLLAALHSRRELTRGEMVRALASERTSTLFQDWAAFLDELVERPADARPNARLPIGDLAAERIRKVYRRMVRMGGAIDSTSPPEAYHELRKKGKELRYLLELFGTPLFSSDVVKPMVKALKALQDVLGHHQDRQVQAGMLGSLRDEVSELPGGPAALMAMGVLVQRLGEDEPATKRQFIERFAGFASKSQRKLVNGAFA
jgi:CHAD domain-containing protein